MIRILSSQVVLSIPNTHWGIFGHLTRIVFQLLSFRQRGLDLPTFLCIGMALNRIYPAFR